MNELQLLTEELIELVSDANKIYHERRNTKQKGDFFQDVKPFADRAKEITLRWEEAAMEWRTNPSGTSKYIHPPQIKSTVENLELISVQAFFPETSYTRFKNYVESTIYILNQLLIELR